MGTESKSLLRFVQVRRLAEPQPGACADGKAAAEAASDFSAVGSKDVLKTVASGDAEAIEKLAAAVANRLSSAGRSAAKVAIALLARATLDQRLTVAGLRTELERDWKTLFPTRADGRKAIEDAITWAVDLSLVGSAGGTGASQLLRGAVLLRMADSKAEGTCLVRSLTSKRAIILPKPPANPADSSGNERLKELESLRLDVGRMRLRIGTQKGVKSDVDALLRSNFADLPEAAKKVRSKTTTFGITGATAISQFERILDEEIANERKKIFSGNKFMGQQLKPNFPKGWQGWAPSSPQRPPEPVVPVLAAQARVLGRADLMIIRTEHLRYELGELAHIENVLASEERSRTHVYDTSVSEMREDSSREERENVHELATTEENALERAMETATSSNSSMSAGVNVSGGFGPVEAGMNVDAARSTSTSGSNSSAVSYAKSVTERAVETVRSEVARRRTVTTQTRVTETNLHKFDNSAGTANIAGLYRWVNKVDRAQVYNYGERVLLEFVVPEPAAQYVQIVQARQAESAPVPPEGWDLALADITPETYVQEGTRWSAIGLEVPPAEEIWVAQTFVEPAAKPLDFDQTKADDSQPSWGFSSHVAALAIPDGYAAVSAIASVTWGLSSDETPGDTVQNVDITIGGKSAELDDGSDNSNTIEFDMPVSGPLAIGISIDQRGGAAVAFQVRCGLTTPAREAWKLRTYEAIRSAYIAEKGSYENAMRVFEARKAYASVTPPETNRRLEAQELKRGCQSILTGQEFDLFGALEFSGAAIPRIDASEAASEAVYMQFFEECLDWENLTYRLFPYQWAGRHRWPELLGRSSVDPLHQSFLQAGAARVVVPIRLGYEEALGKYLATSAVPVPDPVVWNAAENSYPPIGEAYSDTNQRDGAEVAIGEPWEIVTPTPLVYLQSNANLNGGA